MTALKIPYLNPIDLLEYTLEINYPEVDYYVFKSTKAYNNGDKDLVKILDTILKDLDCTVIFDYGRNCMTKYPIYKVFMSKYFYYLSRISNCFVYNAYLDKLIKAHQLNINFEYIYPDVVPNKVKTKKAVKSKKHPNKFFKSVTKDIFTGKDIYIYTNPSTNEQIESNNSNLLDELNARKPKQSRKVTSGVPLSAMTFSFNKK